MLAAPGAHRDPGNWYGSSNAPGSAPSTSCRACSPRSCPKRRARPRTLAAEPGAVQRRGAARDRQGPVLRAVRRATAQPLRPHRDVGRRHGLAVRAVRRGAGPDRPGHQQHLGPGARRAAPPGAGGGTRRTVRRRGGLATCYLARPEQTAAAFLPDPEAAGERCTAPATGPGAGWTARSSSSAGPTTR
ncbi:hypothetical protein NKH77_07630 [Streptomyces sp. M19]